MYTVHQVNSAVSKPNIVTTTSVFPAGYPEDQALTRLAAIGYTHLDIAFDYCCKDGSSFLSENWRDWALHLSEQANSLGVAYTHSHACGDARARGTHIERCFEACAILGIRYTVIHPIYTRADGSFYESDDEFISVNTEAIKPLLDLAEKHNVIALSENILWEASSLPTAIAGLVSEVNSPFFGWCFDTGHAHCLNIPMSELLNVSAIPLSLHIQDNNGAYGRDEHLMPGDGTINWNEFLNILIQIGYKGDLVLEAHHQALEAPDERREELLNDLLNRAREMQDYYSYNLNKKTPF